MHPFYDEKSYFAFSNDKSLIISNFRSTASKSEVVKAYSNPPKSKIKFLQWQDKNNGFLASVSVDNVISIYDKGNQPLRPVALIKENENITCLKCVSINDSHSAKEYHYIIIGYHSCIKLWNLTENIFKIPDYIQRDLKGPIDIIQKNTKRHLLLIGSTVTKVIQGYEFKGRRLELLYELSIPFNEKLTDAFFVGQEGLVAVCNMKILLYYTIGRKVYRDQVLEFDHPIANFKVINSQVDSNNYFVYTKDDKLITTQFKFDNSQMRVIAPQRIEREKKEFIDEMKKKDSVTIEEVDKDTLSVKINDVILNIVFKSTGPSVSIIQIPNSELNEKLKKEIDRFNKESYRKEELIEKFIDGICKMITERPQMRLDVKKESHKTIIPYVKTCGFCWVMDGKMLFYQYNKIDFKQFKPNDKIISTYNTLESWVKFSVNKDAKTKFTSSDNKLIDDDEPTGQIIHESLRKVSGWNLSFDLDINYFLQSINTYESLPKVFSYYENQAPLGNHKNALLPTSAQANCIYETPVKGQYETSRRMNSNEYESNFRELFFIHEVKKSESYMRILPKLKIKLLSRESFYKSINSLLESINDEETTILIDILNHFNFNINSILEQKSELLIEFYKKNIFTLVQTLEIRKKYEYLFICLIVIASRIFYDVTNSNQSSPKQESSPEEDKRTGSFIYFRNSQSNTNLKQSVHSLHSAEFDGRRKTSMNTSVINSNNKIDIKKGLNKTLSKASDLILISESNHQLKDMEYAEASEDFEGVSVDEGASFELKKNPIELDYSFNMSYGYNEQYEASKDINQVINPSKQSTHQPLNNLLKIFGDNTVSVILNYLYFISGQLHRMNRVNESAEMLKFLSIISNRINNKCIQKEIEMICANVPRYVNNNITSAQKNKEKEKKEIDEQNGCFKINENTKKTAICVYCNERIRKGLFSVMATNSKCSYVGHFHEVIKWSSLKTSLPVIRKRHLSFAFPHSSKNGI